MENSKPVESYEESKRRKFVELAEKRVSNSIKSISLIGNLANKNNYIYNNDDVKKILTALQDEIKAVEARFKSNPSNEKIFKL
jgi:hypothetical protein